MGGPLVSMANAVVPPAERVREARRGRARHEADGRSMARIPTPVTASAAEPSPDAPLNLQARFDLTGPAEPDAEGPPIPLDVADQAAAAPAQASIPPLPRIRPCGAGGPACP